MPSEAVVIINPTRKKDVAPTFKVAGTFRTEGEKFTICCKLEYAGKAVTKMAAFCGRDVPVPGDPKKCNHDPADLTPRPAGPSRIRGIWCTDFSDVSVGKATLTVTLHFIKDGMQLSKSSDPLDYTIAAGGVTGVAACPCPK